MDSMESIMTWFFLMPPELDVTQNHVYKFSENFPSDGKSKRLTTLTKFEKHSAIKKRTPHELIGERLVSQLNAEKSKLTWLPLDKFKPAK